MCVVIIWVVIICVCWNYMGCNYMLVIVCFGNCVYIVIICVLVIICVHNYMCIVIIGVMVIICADNCMCIVIMCVLIICVL